MSDWYADATFVVHADMKSRTGGVSAMGKLAIQKNQRIRISIQKVLQNHNWYQRMMYYHLCYVTGFS